MLLGVGIAAVILITVVINLMRQSSRGQLRQTCGELRKASRDQKTAARRVTQALRRVEKLHARREKVKPRILQEAKEALEDARSLAKIADDKVLIAENHVRRVIVEEYPPQKQEKMRRKYLPGRPFDEAPFHFDK